ncbi:MAG: hypothetical protein KQI81_11235 [Deltaproteobacteria bacterium]|nr:hypothetical protein [Deltaproteobacteria bacterium]
MLAHEGKRGVFRAFNRGKTAFQPTPPGSTRPRYALRLTMDNSFNPKEYLDHVARELIANFAHAGRATTPSLVGGARETEVRRKLSALLPPMVSVGSGCVIDSYGNTSKQIDIIIYEKQICPVFSLNDTPETTYFPCEGVVAIGEVKSLLDTKELEDSYEKIASVKKLKRHAEATDGLNGKLVAFRHYGNLTTFDPAPEEEFNQATKHSDQIYGFVFAGELGLKPETLCSRAASIFSSFTPQTVPNLFVILNHGVMLYMDLDARSFATYPVKGMKGMYITGKRPDNFQTLLRYLYSFVRQGRTTSPNVFQRYLLGNSPNTMELDGNFSLFAKDA